MHHDQLGGDGSASAPYSVSAEFYDILQAESDRRSAERRFAAAAATATLGIVDVGAGTGIVTEVLLARSTTPIHAVEPSAAMRVGLLTRLAGLGADQRARVTVHPETLESCGLNRVADLVVCANMAGVVEPAQRRALWHTVAAVLVPGGVLLMEPPPTELPDEPETRELSPVRVGPDTYSAQVCIKPDRGLMLLTYTYRVERDGQTVRREQEQFTMWPASAETVRAELRDAGLHVSARAPKGLVRATLGSTASNA